MLVGRDMTGMACGHSAEGKRRIGRSAAVDIDKWSFWTNEKDVENCSLTQWTRPGWDGTTTLDWSPQEYCILVPVITSFHRSIVHTRTRLRTTRTRRTRQNTCMAAFYSGMHCTWVQISWPNPTQTEGSSAAHHYFNKCRLLICRPMHVKVKTNMRHKSEDSVNIKLSSVTRWSSSHLASRSD